MISRSWVKTIRHCLLGGSAHGLMPYRNQCRPALEVLEDRAQPSTIYWGNSSGGAWNVASNWQGGALPGHRSELHHRHIR
jgi:hypothetical protein